MASFADRALFFIAGTRLGDSANDDTTSDAKIIAGWEKIIADPRTTPGDRLKAERMLEQYKGAITDPAEGSGKIFTDEVKAQAKGIASGAAEGVFSAFPWWIYLLVAVFGFIYLDLRFRK